jgi:eukaryotic-like serine/threonine-protein kinase
MGEVYRARDTRLKRDVAIKILPRALAADPERLARFQREAEVLASLNHPNIAQVYGLEDGPPETGVHARALVMELVEGQDLAERLANGPIPVDETLRIGRQMADALEAAHEHGVIHRDLKPANIRLAPDGTVKVLDFGLAKAVDTAGGPGSSAAPDHSPTLTSPVMTGHGVILGTAAYMAPEQAKGRAVDRRADIWAFGCVLYEMLTGRHAFRGEDVADTLAAVLTREIDWTALPPDTPVPVRTLARRCLVRDPKQRLRDIGDARLILDEALSGVPDEHGTRPGAASPVWRQVLPWVLAATATIAAAVVWMTSSRLADEPPRAVTRARTDVAGLVGFLSLSPDGSQVAFTSAGEKTLSLRLRRLDQLDAHPIPGADNAAFPIFSPDGRWIAFTTASQPLQIRKIPVTGGTSILVGPGDFHAGGAWGGDDTIVFAGPTGLMRLPASGGQPEPLTRLDAARGETAHVRPQFLPGGRRLLFTIVAGVSIENAAFAVLDLEMGTHERITRGGVNGRYVASGHLTFVRGSTLLAVPFDLPRLAVTGAEVPVLEHVSTVGPEGTGDYTVSDTGLLMYAERAATRGRVLGWMDRQGTDERLPAQEPRPWGEGRISPDGRRVAISLQSDGGSDIWVVDIARGTPTRLTFGGENRAPIWTPDGRGVVYGARQDDRFGIHAIQADGESRPELLLATDGRAVPSSFTPDGRLLLFEQQDADGSKVYALPRAEEGTAEARLLLQGSGSQRDAQVSPDGRFIAYSSTEAEGVPDIYLHPLAGPGGKVRVSVGGGRNPRWAREGQELFFRATSRLPMAAIMAVEIPPDTAQPGAPREVVQAPSRGWDVAPDGQRFLVQFDPAEERQMTIFITVTNWFDEIRRLAPAAR